MIALPPADRDYLASKGIAFEATEENGSKAIILRSRPLPCGRFDATAADVLILLPGGYPDVAPDMFYLEPWVRLTTTNTYPRAADQPLEFGGRRWQRWSRHNPEWRPGTDGIWTMIKRVEEALEKAAA
ncbi:MAG: hypothetical protein IPI75_20895 [Gammaproteobacteria bacterium]|jgi:hypothetical protein|nr:hypothetical protein [Gammaproteobacteria bacterium]